MVVKVWVSALTDTVFASLVCVSIMRQWLTKKKQTQQGEKNASSGVSIR